MNTVGVTNMKDTAFERFRPLKISKRHVPESPANPVPLLTAPTSFVGNPFKNPKNVASPIPQLIPVNTLDARDR